MKSPKPAAPRARMRKTVARNRKAYHDYYVEDRYDAGLSLTGSEVKAVRRGDVSLDDSYVRPDAQGNLVWLNGHIREYREANLQNHEPRRTRRLLLKRPELDKIDAAVRRKGYTAIPLELYFDGPWAKLELGLCRGKKAFDKRQVLKDREARRDMDRTVKRYVS